MSVGPPGSGNAVTAWNVLEAMGIGESDFTVRQLNYAQMSNGLKDGTLDAGFIAGGVGMPAVVEIGVSRDMVLVPFTEEEIATIVRAEPAYSGFVMPPGVYRGMDEPVLTPTLWNLLVVLDTMDDGLAYDLTRTMLERRFVPVAAGLHSRRAGVPEALAAIGAGLAALAAVRIFAPADAPALLDRTLIGLIVSAAAFALVAVARGRLRTG